MNNILTTRNKDVCTYTGVFGVMFSLTCLVQHFIIAKPHWITTCLALTYLFSIIAFGLLTAQRSPAPLLLIINCILLLAAVIVLIKSGIFSLVVLLTFIYAVIIAITTYIDGLPAKLKQKAIAIKEEKQEWRDRW